MRNIIYLFFLIPTFIYSQNVGIGTNNPTQKLEVDGKIRITNPQGVQGAGGIVFPDNTFQNTAYNPVPIDGGGGVLFPDGTFQNTAYVANVNEAPEKIVIMVNGGVGDIGSGYAGPVDYFQVNNGFNILAYSNGMSQAGGPPSFQDVSITRYSDEYSARIQNDLATGKNINEIKLFTFRICSGGDLCYSTIETYETCSWTSYSYGGSSGENRLTENVSFNYTKRTVRAYGVSAAGGSTAPGSGHPYIETCFNIATNLSCGNTSQM